MKEIEKTMINSKLNLNKNLTKNMVALKNKEK